MKIQEPTLLRMFTINDQAFRAKDGEEGPPLRTDLIEPVELADGKGKASKRMGQWLQHVHLLGVLQEPLAFDLMFVDIKFEKDPWAPGYGDGSVNPMGLLHALTFASKQDPWGTPFVWGYHSGDPASVKDDPIAIIAFSLLSALEQRVEENVLGSPWKWDDVGLHKSPGYAVQHFSNAIECLPRGGPELILQDMMVRYRQKLLSHVGDDRLAVLPDPLEAAARWATSGTETDRRELAKACIRLSNRLGPKWTRDILLQSIFADALVEKQDIWPAGKVLGDLRDFLKDLKAVGQVETKEFWVARVDEIMRRIENDEPTVLNGIRPRERKKRVGALAIMCWWLQAKAQELATRDMRTEVKKFNTNDLLTDFGYNDAHREPVEGCLGAFGHKKLRSFFDHLETTEEPVGSPFHEVGRYWWKNRCNGRDEAMPLWLR